MASPRPSIGSTSRRTSSDTATSTASRPAAAARGSSLRRNRAALRDYYHLTPAAAAGEPAGTAPPQGDGEAESELDRRGFRAETYVAGVLGRSGAEALLGVAAGLARDIRSLEGEKKALVYDNYAKLIAATDTIRHMREHMDPVTPAAQTLAPAVAHIARTAAALAGEGGGPRGGDAAAARMADEARRRRQRESVRWVLGAPARWAAMEKEAARGEWARVRPLLEKWKHVAGVEDIREQCLRALG